MMPDGFLHLTDASSGLPVRIRLSKVDALYEVDDSVEFNSHSGATVATMEQKPYTVVGYGEGGMVHEVMESVADIECQMADFYELAGIAAAQ